MLKGFRDFIARGNMVEMAVAFVMGSAVTAIVTSLVDSVINPLIAAIFSMPDMDKVWNVTVNGSVVRFGSFVGAIINFLIIALVVYFCIVVPMNKLAEMSSRKKEEGKEELSDEEWNVVADAVQRARPSSLPRSSPCCPLRARALQGQGRQPSLACICTSGFSHSRAII